MQKKSDIQYGRRFTKLKKTSIQWLFTCLFILFIIGLSSCGLLSDSEESRKQVLSFRVQQYAVEHFEKHRDEFDYQTVEEYVTGANQVISSPNVLHKREKEDGDDVYYAADTNELVIVSTDGYIRTYFKPEDGMDYYQRQ